jgi:hypothetical protein
MHRTRIASLTLAGLLLTVVSRVEAQSPLPQRDSSRAGCTYAMCALRAEPAFFGRKLREGAGGTTIRRGLSVWNPRLPEIVATSDSAHTYARSFVSNGRKSEVLGLLAAVGYAVWASGSRNFNEPTDAAVIGAISALGFGVAAIPFSIRRERSLSRAVWWYNSTLPR